MSNPKTKTQPVAPDLSSTAAELAASITGQAAAMAAATAAEAEITARAYKLLQEDQAAGREPKGWSDYLAKASQEPSTKN